LRFSHRELRNSPNNRVPVFKSRKRLRQTANQPPIAILAKQYPISWRYVNLGELFHRLEISSAAAMEEIKLLAMASGVRRRGR
jgi:hypothetical protein